MVVSRRLRSIGTPRRPGLRTCPAAVHLTDPRAVVPESNMPAFPWLARNAVDGRQIAAHMQALQRIGDPYTDAEIASAAGDVAGKTELDAVVAYLQGLGKHAPRGN